MKLAVCLSGEARDYLNCYENFFRFLGSHDCDYFINIWDHVGGKINADVNQFDYIEQDVDKVELTRIYQPTELRIDRKIEWDPCKQLKPFYQGYRESFIPMYCGWYKAFLLLKKHVTSTATNYDAIIRTRMDLNPFHYNNFNLSNVNLKDSILCTEGVTRLSNGVVKPYWKNHKYDLSRCNQQLEIIWQALDSINKEQFEFSTSTLKFFQLEGLERYIDISPLYLLPKRIDSELLGISDMFNITNFENYEKYSSVFLLFMLFFELKRMDDLFILREKIHPFNFIVGCYQLERKIIENFSFHLSSCV